MNFDITHVSIDGTKWYVYNPNWYPENCGCPVIETTNTEKEAQEFIADGYSRINNVIPFPRRDR